MKRRQVTKDRNGDIVKVVEFHEPALSVEKIILIIWRFLLITHIVALFFGVLLGKFIYTNHL